MASQEALLAHIVSSVADCAPSQLAVYMDAVAENDLLLLVSVSTLSQKRRSSRKQPSRGALDSNPGPRK